MNPIVLMWGASKIIEILGLLFIKGWKVWIVLFAIEGVFSATSDLSVLRRVVLYDSTKAEIRRVVQEVECEFEQKRAVEASQAPGQ